MPNKSRIFLNDIDLNTFFTYFNETNITNKNLELLYQTPENVWRQYTLTLNIDNDTHVFYTRYSHLPKLKIITDNTTTPATYSLSSNDVDFICFLFSIGNKDQSNVVNTETEELYTFKEFMSRSFNRVVNGESSIRLTDSLDDESQETYSIEISYVTGNDEYFNFLTSFYKIPKEHILVYENSIFNHDTYDQVINGVSMTISDYFDNFPAYSPYSHLYITNSKIYYMAEFDETTQKITYLDPEVDFTEEDFYPTDVSIKSYTSLSDKIIQVFNSSNSSIGFIVANDLVKTPIKYIVNGEDSQYVKEYQTPYGSIQYELPDLSRFELYVNAIRQIFYGTDQDSFLALGSESEPYKSLLTNYQNVNSLSALSRIYEVNIYQKLNDDSDIPPSYENLDYECYAVDWFDTEDSMSATELVTTYDNLSELINLDSLRTLDVVKYDVEDNSQYFTDNSTLTKYCYKDIIYLAKNKLYDYTTDTKAKDFIKVDMYSAYSDIFGEDNPYEIYCALNYDSAGIPTEPVKYIRMNETSYQLTPIYDDESISILSSRMDQYYFTVNSYYNETYGKEYISFSANHSDYEVLTGELNGENIYYIQFENNKIMLYPFYNNTASNSKYKINITIKYKFNNVAYAEFKQDMLTKELYFYPPKFNNTYSIKYKNNSYIANLKYKLQELPYIEEKLNIDPMTIDNVDYYLSSTISDKKYRDIYTNEIIKKSTYLIVDSNFKDSLSYNNNTNYTNAYHISNLAVNDWSDLIDEYNIGIKNITSSETILETEPDNMTIDVSNTISSLYYNNIDGLEFSISSDYTYNPGNDDGVINYCTISTNQRMVKDQLYDGNKTLIEYDEHLYLTTSDLTYHTKLQESYNTKLNKYNSLITHYTDKIANETQRKNNLLADLQKELDYSDELIEQKLNEIEVKKQLLATLTPKTQKYIEINTQYLALQKQYAQLQLERDAKIDKYEETVSSIDKIIEDNTSFKNRTIENRDLLIISYRESYNNFNALDKGFSIYEYDTTDSSLTVINPIDSSFTYDPVNKEYYLGREKLVTELVKTVVETYEKDSDGNKIPDTDENGDRLYLYTEDMQPVYETDEDGNFVLDENGNKIHKIAYKTIEDTTEEVTEIKKYEFISSLIDFKIDTNAIKPYSIAKIGIEYTNTAKTKFKIYFMKDISMDPSSTDIRKLYLNITKFGMPLESDVVKSYYLNNNSTITDRYNNSENRGEYIAENLNYDETKEYFFDNLKDLLNNKNEQLSLVSSYSSDYLPKIKLWIKALYDLYSTELRINNGAFLSIQKFEDVSYNLKINDKVDIKNIILTKNNDDDIIPIPEVSDHYVSMNLSENNLTDEEIIEIDRILHSESPYARLLRYNDFPTYYSYRDHLIRKKAYDHLLYDYNKQHIADDEPYHVINDLKYTSQKNIDFKKNVMDLLVNYYYDNLYSLNDDNETVSFYLNSFDIFLKNKISTESLNSDVLYSDDTFAKISYPGYVQTAQGFDDWADGIIDLLEKGWCIN